MKEQVKYLKCVSGGVTGISVGDVRKAWCDKWGGWEVEDVESPDSPWVLDYDSLKIPGLNCYFEEVAEIKSAPVFGDVLHINGEPFVFIKSSPDHYYTTINQEGVVRECDAEMFDEYAPNPYQEQRERILNRWKGKSLDNAHDTEVCVAEVRLSDLIDFVQENILAES